MFGDGIKRIRELEKNKNKGETRETSQFNYIKYYQPKER